jgi:hypothetical protein
MRVDDEMCHKILKGDEFSVNSESEFRNYCDVFVNILSRNEQTDEIDVKDNGDRQQQTQADMAVERGDFPS